MSKDHGESSLESYIGKPQYTDKKGEEVDIFRALGAARFERTIGKVWKQEAKLVKLLEEDPTKLSPDDLVKAKAFGERLFERIMRNHENARNPENPVGIISLKPIKPELDQSLRDEEVTESEKVANLLLQRIETFRREIERRGVGSIKEGSDLNPEK